MMEHYTDNDSDAVREKGVGREEDERKTVWSFPEVINTSKRSTSRRKETNWERSIVSIYVCTDVEYMRQLGALLDDVPYCNLQTRILSREQCQGTFWRVWKRGRERTS